MVARIGLGGWVAAIASGVPLVAAAQEPGAGMMAQVVGFTALGVMMVLIVVIALHYDARTHRRRIALIEQYLAQGREVPRELLQPKYDGRTPAERRQHSFRRGMVLVCWAAGIAVVLYLLFPGNLLMMVWGLPFLFLGAGHFFNGVFLSGAGERRNGDSST